MELVCEIFKKNIIYVKHLLSEIREVGLKLHPGDWWSQNVALGWHMVFSNLNPDVAIIDHSARYFFS